MSWNTIKKTLGPGILFASTAIGVSHLVQSTRAGADYGFALFAFVILANVLKFPFFEYAARYAAATGETLIDGYKRLGKLAIWGYFIAILASMFFVTAAIGMVTAGFMDNLFGLSTLWPSFELFPVVLVFVISAGVLLLGKFNFIDSIIKVIGGILFISTLVVFILILIKGPEPYVAGFQKPEVFNEVGILFIIALMGWMPTALDISSWVSLWSVEKMKTTNYHPTLKESLFDFNLGYWISVFLSICFLCIGAFLLYGTGRELPSDSVGFADGIINLYSETIGQWSYILIAISAFSIMLGTSLGVFDGYSRTLQRISKILFFSETDKNEEKRLQHILVASILILSIGSLSIIIFFKGQFKVLIDLATTISFLIAPLIAIANFSLVSKKYVAEAFVPNRFMKLISYIGIVFLTGFALFYIYIKIS